MRFSHGETGVKDLGEELPLRGSAFLITSCQEALDSSHCDGGLDH